MKRQRYLLISGICLACLLSFAFTVYSFRKEISKPKLPFLGRVQPFTLIDSANQEFQSSRLQGKVWVANFFFTTCGDICPILSKHMATLSKSFQKVPDVLLISISVNPEQDSPSALASYAQRFQEGKKNWYFLTGERENITEIVVKSFKLGHMTEPIFHSPHFTLIDRNGNS